MERTILDILRNWKGVIERINPDDDRVTVQLTLADAEIIIKALENEAELSKPLEAVKEKHNVIENEFAHTISEMTSPDYKERFKAEYHQTKIRYEKLKKFNTRIEAAFATNYRKNAVEMPVFDCPQDMLREQQKVMGEYLHILEVRAVIEGVDLTSI